jgi:predicted transcriptional regulator of viral defense system
MKLEFLVPFNHIPYFTIEGFKQSSGMASPHAVRMLLHRWLQAGHLLSLKKGVYMTRRFYEQHRQDNDFAAAVSAILLPQSYVSLEYVLQEHNMLTEVTYPVTCVTTRNTRTITNPVGTFWYRSIRPDLYGGFTIVDYLGIRYARASLAKALFDYLYLRPIPPSYRSAKFNLADELRLNLDEMDGYAQEEFAAHVESSRSTKMHDILRNFRGNLWQL